MGTAGRSAARVNPHYTKKNMNYAQKEFIFSSMKVPERRSGADNFCVNRRRQNVSQQTCSHLFSWNVGLSCIPRRELR